MSYNKYASIRSKPFVLRGRQSFPTPMTSSLAPSEGEDHMAANAAAPAVAAAAERLRALMVSPQEDALYDLVSDAISYGHSDGKLDTKAAFIGDLLSRRSHFVSIDITNQTIFLAGDVAVLRHALSAATLDGGHPASVQLFVLQIWKSTGEGWQLLARQAVRQAQTK